MNEFKRISTSEFRRSSVYAIIIPKYKGKDIIRVRKKLKLNRAEFGRLLSVTQRTVADWETDNVLPMTAQLKLIYLFDNEPLLVPKYFYKYTEEYENYFEDDRFDEL